MKKPNIKKHSARWVSSKSLLFKNAVIDIFRNWVQFIILTVLIFLSGVVFTLMWTTSTRMNETVNETNQISNLHDYVLEENFTARNSDATNPLNAAQFDDHGVKSNYVQKAIDSINKDLTLKYQSRLDGQNFFTVNRRATRIFAKKINNEQYLFKLVAYPQSPITALDNKGKPIQIVNYQNSVDNIIDAQTKDVLANDKLFANDSQAISDTNSKLGYYTVAVDSMFAKANNLKTGDYICPTSSNDNSLKCTAADMDETNSASVPLKITVMGYSADLTYPMLDQTTVLPNNKVDGVIYVNPWLFGLVYQADIAWNDAHNDNYDFWSQQAPDKISSSSAADDETYYSIKINPAVRNLDADQLLNQEAAKYMTLTAGNNGKYFYNVNDNAYRYHFRTSIIGMMTGIYVSTLSIVLVVFMIICFAVMILLVKKQIGYAINKIATLKALGYSRADIYSSYLAYPLIVGIIGGFLGWLVGSALQVLPVRAFQTYFMVPFSPFAWSGFAFGMSFVVLTAVLTIITLICCFAIISQDYLKLQNGSRSIRFTKYFQATLNRINPRSNFKVRFNNAIFAKSIGKVSTTLVALFVGTGLITIAIFAPKSVNEMMDKTYLNEMNTRAGETHYELPTWNNPFSFYHMYNINDKLPNNYDANNNLVATQNVLKGDLSAYNYEPFHYDKDVLDKFHSALGGFGSDWYMASVGAANLPNSNYQIYDKNYLNSLDQVEASGMAYSGVAAAGSIAIPEYALALDVSNKNDPSEWAALAAQGKNTPDTFAEKYKVKNDAGGITYYTIFNGTTAPGDHAKEISRDFCKQHGLDFDTDWYTPGANPPASKNYLEEMPLNIVIKTGMLDRSPWFVRDKLTNSNDPYGDAFGLMPFNSLTDELALYFNPKVMDVNGQHLSSDIKIDGYGIDPANNLNLVQLSDAHHNNLNSKLLNTQKQVDGDSLVYPVVINQSLAKIIHAGTGDQITINPNNNTAMIKNQQSSYAMDPFAPRQNGKSNEANYDVDYSTVDFNENPTFGQIKNSKNVDDSIKAVYDNTSENQFHLSRQLKMSEIYQQTSAPFIGPITAGDYADNYNGAYYDEVQKKYVPSHSNMDLRQNQRAVTADNKGGNIVLDRQADYNSDPLVGEYNSWSAQYQTGAGKLIYNGNLFGQITNKNVKLKIIGVDDSYGKSKLYVLNHNNYQATSEASDQNYAEQMLGFDHSKDYMTPLFLQQVYGTSQDFSRFAMAQFSPIVNHYWTYQNGQFKVNSNRVSTTNNPVSGFDPTKNGVDTIHNGMYYNLPPVLREAMNYMYPVYNAKFTSSTNNEDVLNNLPVYQKDGDYTRLTLGGGQEFGDHASSVVYPQYGYSSITYSALISQEYGVMSNFVNLILVALYFFVAIALLICLMIIVFTANIIIQENKRMITTMKVLGYRNREVVRYVLGMYFPIIIIGLITGIVGGYYIFVDIINSLPGAFGGAMILPTPTTWWIFLVIVILILAIYWISLVGSYITLKRTNAVDALKDL